MIKRILFLIILTLFSAESCLGFGVGTVGVLGSGVAESPPGGTCATQSAFVENTTSGAETGNIYGGAVTWQSFTSTDIDIYSIKFTPSYVGANDAVTVAISASSDGSSPIASYTIGSTEMTADVEYEWVLTTPITAAAGLWYIHFSNGSAIYADRVKMKRNDSGGGNNTAIPDGMNEIDRYDMTLAVISCD